MPYVDKYREHLTPTLDSAARNAGDLNYQLTMVVIDYLNWKGLSYQICNDIVGALDNCKDEFRRRIQHPYEDAKIEQNGDVY